MMKSFLVINWKLIEILIFQIHKLMLHKNNKQKQSNRESIFSSSYSTRVTSRRGLTLHHLIAAARTFVLQDVTFVRNSHTIMKYEVDVKSYRNWSHSSYFVYLMLLHLSKIHHDNLVWKYVLSLAAINFVIQKYYY